MAGLNETHLQARCHGKRLVVGGGFELLQDPLGVREAVKRLGRRLACPPARAVEPLSVLGLDFGGITQNQPGHFNRGRSGKNGPGETRPRQQWQAAGMIEMCMRENHGIQPRRAGSHWRAVQGLHVVALEQPAVDEHRGLKGFDEISRPGDFTAGGAKNRDSHVGRMKQIAGRPDWAHPITSEGDAQVQGSRASYPGRRAQELLSAWNGQRLCPNDAKSFPLRWLECEPLMADALLVYGTLAARASWGSPGIHQSPPAALRSVTLALSRRPRSCTAVCSAASWAVWAVTTFK